MVAIEETEWDVRGGDDSYRRVSKSSVGDFVGECFLLQGDGSSAADECSLMPRFLFGSTHEGSLIVMASSLASTSRKIALLGHIAYKRHQKGNHALGYLL